MNKNPATAAQLLALHALEMKRLEPVADEEKVKEAIKSPDHPFWKLYEVAIATLVLAVEEVTKDVKQVVKAVMKKIMETTTPAIGKKKVSDCFIDRSRYCDPDPDINCWLPEVQLEQPASTFLVNELAQELKFKEMVEEVVSEKGDIKKLSRLLIDRHHTTTLPTIEFLIERQEGGEDVGLRKDGNASFFFVEDKEGGVSVVGVNRNDGPWYVYVRRLDYGRCWFAGPRVFVRNS